MKFFGTAPGNPAHDHLSLLVRRRQTTRTTFIAVFAPSNPATEPAVRGVRWLQTDSAPFAFAVETAQGSEHWQIGPDLINPELTFSPRPLET